MARSNPRNVLTYRIRLNDGTVKLIEARNMADAADKAKVAFKGRVSAPILPSALVPFVGGRGRYIFYIALKQAQRVAVGDFGIKELYGEASIRTSAVECVAGSLRGAES